ncbi:hypothetical protein GCM10008905_19710 [Clostridium malenominatum]|uniref:Lipoprotein n=1 Tax=Clostridium malenominatum TaxID=1539 RepID=A0ABN1J073_9CLOT
MKKILIGLITVICIAIFMVGCRAKEQSIETGKIESTVEKDKNKASEEVFTEFIKVLETSDSLKTKEFIVDNIEKVSEEIADKMVREYELLLNTNFDKLEGRYFNAINEMNEGRKLDLEKIKDEKIKDEVKKTVTSGYTFKMREGAHYLTIDYAMIADNFSQYLSKNLKPYYELRKKDQQKPIFNGEYINVDVEEVKNRVVTLEKAIKDNRGLANREDIKDLMKWHIQALLTISHFNKDVDFETGKVNDSVKNAYKELKESDLKISKYAAEEMDKLLTEYKFVIKQDGGEAYKKVNSLKFKIVDEVGKKVEEYYLVK